MPQDERDASLALGATKWQTIRHVVLPLAIPGIVTGIILTAGRIFGEAAALIFTAGLSTPGGYDFSNFNLADPQSPWSPFHTSTTLSVYIWKLNSEGLEPIRAPDRRHVGGNPGRRGPRLQPRCARPWPGAATPNNGQPLTMTENDVTRSPDATIHRPDPASRPHARFGERCRCAGDPHRGPANAAADDTKSHETRIAVKDLSIYYGAKRAVRDVTLDVPANAVTAFIGPSGCGKSTILRCFNRMNDLIPGARITGEVVLNGEDIYEARRAAGRGPATRRASSSSGPTRSR